MLIHTNITECTHPWMKEGEADAEFWITFANQAAPSIHLAIAIDGIAAGGIGIIAGEGIARHTGQFGYWLGEKHWGKGISHRSCSRNGRSRILGLIVRKT